MQDQTDTTTDNTTGTTTSTAPTQRKPRAPYGSKKTAKKAKAKRTYTKRDKQAAVITLVADVLDDEHPAETIKNLAKAIAKKYAIESDPRVGAIIGLAKSLKR